MQLGFDGMKCREKSQKLIVFSMYEVSALSGKNIAKMQSNKKNTRNEYAISGARRKMALSNKI